MKKLEKLIVDFVRINPGASSSDLAVELKSSQSTVSRHLKALADRSEIIKKGSTKSSVYFIDELTAYFNVSPHLRAPVEYSFSAFERISRDLFTENELVDMRESGRTSQDLSTQSLQVYRQFILDLSFSSSKLEGNLYTYVDTQALLDYNEYAKNKPQSDGTMIVNHKNALEYILSNLNDVDIDAMTIKDIHSLLSVNLPGVTPEEQGACRTRIVHMNGSAFIPLNSPHELPMELERLLSVCRDIKDPINQSLFLLGAIPYLQAFVDVNKRVGRLMCSVPLIKSGLAPFSFISINKAEYTKGIASIYELQNIEPLKKAYQQAYLESAPVFVASLSDIKAINPLKIQYRHEIEKAVSHIVKEKTAPNLGFIDDIDREQVKVIVLEITDKMHAGSAIAYSVNRKEFDSFSKIKEVTVKKIKEGFWLDTKGPKT